VKGLDASSPPPVIPETKERADDSEIERLGALGAEVSTLASALALVVTWLPTLSEIFSR
jgi:hypothetical protein